jgi:hypothetical protein
MQKRLEQKTRNAKLAYKSAKSERDEARKHCQSLAEGKFLTLKHLLGKTEGQFSGSPKLDDTGVSI